MALFKKDSTAAAATPSGDAPDPTTLVPEQYAKYLGLAQRENAATARGDALVAERGPLQSAYGRADTNFRSVRLAAADGQADTKAVDAARQARYEAMDALELNEDKTTTARGEAAELFIKRMRALEDEGIPWARAGLNGALPASRLLIGPAAAAARRRRFVSRRVTRSRLRAGLRRRARRRSQQSLSSAVLPAGSAAPGRDDSPPPSPGPS